MFCFWHHHSSHGGVETKFKNKNPSTMFNDEQMIYFSLGDRRALVELGERRRHIFVDSRQMSDNTIAWWVWMTGSFVSFIFSSFFSSASRFFRATCQESDNCKSIFLCLDGDVKCLNDVKCLRFWISFDILHAKLFDESVKSRNLPSWKRWFEKKKTIEKELRSVKLIIFKEVLTEMQ